MDPIKLPPTEAEWLQHKDAIRMLYLQDGMGQGDLLRELQERGLSVTLSQLKYRLRRWNFRHNLNASAWGEIGKQIDEREKRGKKSTVFNNLRRLEQKKIKRNVERHRHHRVSAQDAGSSVLSFALSSTSQLASQFRVSSPTPPPGELTWPPSLPWARFQHTLNSILTHLHERRQHTTSSQPWLCLERNLPSILSYTQQGMSRTGSSSANLTSIVGTTMPAIYHGNTASCLLTSTGHGGLHVQCQILSLALYHVSNNIHPENHQDEWDVIMAIFRQCGWMEKRLDIPALRETTIAAYIEKLFQAAIIQVLVRMNKEARKIVEWLLCSGYDANTLLIGAGTSRTAKTALHESVEQGQVNMVQLLLEHGANPNSISAEGVRPLEAALSPNYRSHSYIFDFVKKQLPLPTRAKLSQLLVSKGARLNFSGCAAREPDLNLAIGCRDVDLVKLVIVQGADLRLKAELTSNILHEVTPLNRAAGFQDISSSRRPKGNNPRSLKLLEYIIASLSERFPSSFRDEITADTFIAAAAAGNYDVIKQLASISTPATFTNPLGVTSLHGVAEQGCIKTCQLLLELGCSFNLSLEYISPLHVACAHGHLQIVDMFICKEADVNARTILQEEWCHRHHIDDRPVWADETFELLCSAPMTPLQVAIICGSNECAILLLQNDAKLYGGEMLLSATIFLDVALLTALLDNGADPNEYNDDGDSVLGALLKTTDRFLSISDEGEQEEIWTELVKMVKLLLQFGAKVDEAELVQAFRLGDSSLIQEFLQNDWAGIDAFRSNNTLLVEAIRSNNRTIFDKVWEVYEDGPYIPSAVCAAVLTGFKFGRIKRLFSNRGRHTATHTDEATAVGIAAHDYGDLALLQFLCKSLPTPTKTTCVMPIRYNSYRSKLRLSAIEFSRNFDAWDESTRIEVSPLTYAILGRNVNAFNYLLDYGYEPDWTTWLAAAQENQTPIASALYGRGFTVGEPKKDGLA